MSMFRYNTRFRKMFNARFKLDVQMSREPAFRLETPQQLLVGRAAQIVLFHLFPEEGFGTEQRFRVSVLFDPARPIVRHEHIQRLCGFIVVVVVSVGQKG
eukprot:CAMPEP_0194365276 /NCGR_PEP_ID=MMETSP0174-20130528/13290_1 /TAXON_ID=216777 /ORGANISM="Proboscia alata, Strain PI-D3" /LENGTH=99 /DNA_ID=CAMNT_0039139851 /DNA_START=249 /DNA_END=548 /DNA_ORIENTATION=+